MLENRLKILKYIYTVARKHGLWSCRLFDISFYDENRFDFDVLEADGMIEVVGESDNELAIGLTLKGVHFLESNLLENEKEEYVEIVNSDGEVCLFRFNVNSMKF
ncbi:hypothetical protein NSQ41_12765 [Aeribacillus sp. FSL K6-8210]|uniref:hypothetical protein n=1 Tax=Aeribacillus sp. FSL K6-8210 TaxID=2954683 RepID=UPI0030CB0072